MPIVDLDQLRTIGHPAGKRYLSSQVEFFNSLLECAFQWSVTDDGQGESMGTRLCSSAGIDQRNNILFRRQSTDKQYLCYAVVQLRGARIRLWGR